MISSLDAVKAINEVRADAVVVGTMTPNRYWDSVTENPDLDLPIFGGMGKASSVALGIAIAQPEKKVLCLDGDGSLLMNLGTLVTIAGSAPENLVHFVFEDSVYFTTGGQPVPGSGKFDLAAMARDAGFAGSYEFSDLEGSGKRTSTYYGSGRTDLRVPEGQPSTGAPPFYMGKTGPAMLRLAETLRSR